MTHPLPALEWCVRSSERSAVVDVLCWAVNVAAMPTFFLMGGALAAGVWKRNPGKPFLIHRTRRLLLPLAFAVLVVLPADMYVWLIGWYTQGLIPWKKVLSIKLPSPLSEQFWGVAHLWYLECLWTLSVVAAIVHFGRARLRNVSLSGHAKAPHSRSDVEEGRGEGRQAPILTRPAMWSGLLTRSPAPTAGLLKLHKTFPQLLLVLAASLCLALDPTFLIGFQQTWWPGPAAMAFYGLFFAAGWRSGTTHRPARSATTPGAVIQLPTVLEYPVLSTEYPPSRTRSRTTGLLLAAGLFVLLLPQIHRHVETPFAGLNLFALTTAYAACSWLAANGLFSLARGVKAASVPGPVAFAAEASFWMYLVHHPLVGLTQLALLSSDALPIVKFLFSLTTGVTISLASYAVLVRGTWIGRLLDGRGRPQPVAPQGVPDISVPVRRAA